MKAVVTALLRRNVMRKGVQGGSTFWLLLGAIGALRKGYQRMSKREETIALGERLRPGDELVFRYPGAPSRTTRKEIRLVNERRDQRAKQRQALIAETELPGRRGRSARKALARFDAES